MMPPNTCAGAENAGGERTESERGSITIALLLALVVALVASGVVVTTAWQARTATISEWSFTAQVGARNAATSAREALVGIDPRSDPTLSGLPTSAPEWQPGREANTQTRWWVSPGSTRGQATITAQGRAGVGQPATAQIEIPVRYDYAAARWVPLAIRAG